MQINLYPETQRIRLRDPILKDDDLRSAASKVAVQICTVKNIAFNPKTSSVLIEYENDSLDQEKLKALIPLARKLQAKVSFYTPKKKPEVLGLISDIEQKVKAWA